MTSDSPTAPAPRRGPGRPRKEARTKRVRVSFSLYVAQLEYLRGEAARRGITPSRALQDLLLSQMAVAMNARIRQRAADRRAAADAAADGDAASQAPAV